MATEKLWILEGNEMYALMHNFIQEMVPGEKISLEALKAYGMTGTYRPKPGADPKREAVERTAHWLLSGFSNPTSRQPEKYFILTNNGDGTFTKK